MDKMRPENVSAVPAMSCCVAAGIGVPAKKLVGRRDSGIETTSVLSPESGVLSPESVGSKQD